MNLLFDISPEEVPDRKGKRSKRKSAQAEPEQKPAFSAPKTLAIKAIGKLDGIHACDNESCRGSAHDILYADKDEWLIQCCFCNCTQWVPIIEGHLKEEFRLTEGIFAGMTLREVSEKEHGEAYIKLSAKKHASKQIREACSAWLDQSRQGS